MLELTIPVKDAVKPRRIQISGADDRRQLTAEERQLVRS
jgi:hypothetical protein